MAATVQTLKDSHRETIVKLTNYGTTETNALKVDASALLGADGTGTYPELGIENVTWSCANGTVAIIWDGATDATALVLAGSGSLKPNGSEKISIRNNSTTPIGDILLTTQDWGATSAYTIILHLKKYQGFDHRGSEVGQPTGTVTV